MSKEEENKTNITTISPIIVLEVATLLYFLGWMYLYYFLENFQISIISIDIPFHYFFIYSFATIKYIAHNGINYIIIFLLLSFWVSYIIHTKIQNNNHTILYSSLLIFFASLFCGHIASKNNAEEKAGLIKLFPANRTTLTLKGDLLKDVQQLTPDDVKSLRKCNFSAEKINLIYLHMTTTLHHKYPAQLIFSDKEKYYLYLRRCLGSKTQTNPRGRVIILHKSDVSSIIIIPST